MPTKAELFSTKEKLSGELNEVPGFGEKGIANLNKKGIHTTYQVIGKFLELDRDPQKLHEFLVSEEIEMLSAPLTKERTAQRIADRVLAMGFKCEIKLSPHVIKSTVSKFGDDKKTAFMAKKLTGDLASDFFGIKSTAGFEAAGITSTDKLFAAFLSIIDHPHPDANTKKCDEFYDKLNDLGAASGFKSAIIYQLQSKLAVGIDSEGRGIEYCPTLEPVPEGAIDEEAWDCGERVAPGTGEQQQRTVEQPRHRKPAGDVDVSRKLDFDAPAQDMKKPQEEPASPLTFAVPVVLAMMFVAFMYWPSKSNELVVY